MHGQGSGGFPWALVWTRELIRYRRASAPSPPSSFLYGQDGARPPPGVTLSLSFAGAGREQVLGTGGDLGVKQEVFIKTLSVSFFNFTEGDQGLGQSFEGFPRGPVGAARVVDQLQNQFPMAEELTEDFLSYI